MGRGHTPETVLKSLSHFQLCGNTVISNNFVSLLPLVCIYGTGTLTFKKIQGILIWANYGFKRFKCIQLLFFYHTERIIISC